MVRFQTCITYTHAPEEWKSRIPTFDAKVLPRTIEKLRDRKPVSIVLIGDSISAGCNASGWAGEAPFQPSFPGLLQQHLAAYYQTKVRVTNPSVSGKDTRWEGRTMFHARHLQLVDCVARKNRKNAKECAQMHRSFKE